MAQHKVELLLYYYFPVTVHPEVFYLSYTTAFPNNYSFITERHILLFILLVTFNVFGTSVKQVS